MRINLHDSCYRVKLIHGVFAIMRRPWDIARPMKNSPGGPGCPPAERYRRFTLILPLVFLSKANVPLNGLPCKVSETLYRP